MSQQRVYFEYLSETSSVPFQPNEVVSSLKSRIRHAIWIAPEKRYSEIDICEEFGGSALHDESYVHSRYISVENVGHLVGSKEAPFHVRVHVVNK